MTRELPVAELKRSFSQVLDAAEQGNETVVLRRGRPVAVVTPVPARTRRTLPRPRRPGGLLALAGSFEDWPELEEDVAALILARATAADRPAVEID